MNKYRPIDADSRWNRANRGSSKFLFGIKSQISDGLAHGVWVCTTNFPASTKTDRRPISLVWAFRSDLTICSEPGCCSPVNSGGRDQQSPCCGLPSSRLIRSVRLDNQRTPPR